VPRPTINDTFFAGLTYYVTKEPIGYKEILSEELGGKKSAAKG
jgi:hypothetical protein